MLTGTITFTGKTFSDVIDALNEAKTRIEAENVLGFDHNETSSFRFEISGDEEMSEDELRDAQKAKAQEMFEAFEFDCDVEASDGWEWSSATPDSLRRTVYLADETGPDRPTIRCSYNVSFVKGTTEINEENTSM